MKQKKLAPGVRTISPLRSAVQVIHLNACSAAIASILQGILHDFECKIYPSILNMTLNETSQWRFKSLHRTYYTTKLNAVYSEIWVKGLKDKEGLAATIIFSKS